MRARVRRRGGRGGRAGGGGCRSVVVAAKEQESASQAVDGIAYGGVSSYHAAGWSRAGFPCGWRPRARIRAAPMGPAGARRPAPGATRGCGHGVPSRLAKSESGARGSRGKHRAGAAPAGAAAATRRAAAAAAAPARGPRLRGAPARRSRGRAARHQVQAHTSNSCAAAGGRRGALRGRAAGARLGCSTGADEIGGRRRGVRPRKQNARSAVWHAFRRYVPAECMCT